MTYSKLQVNSYFLSKNRIFYKKKNHKYASGALQSENYVFRKGEFVSRVFFARSCKKGKTHFIRGMVSDGDKCIHCDQRCKVK